MLIAFVAMIAASPLLVAQESTAAKLRAARSAWLKESSRISDLLDKLRSHATVGNRLDEEIEKIEAEVRQAEKELADQLREMAEGKFCSECLRSASQLEAQGEPFLYHVRKVKGRVVPASPEQMEKARKAGEEKIAGIRQRLQRKQAEKDKELSALRDAHHQLLVAIAAYHHAMQRERELQLAKWGEEARDLEKKLTDLQEQLATLAKQPDDPARDIQIRAAEAQMRTSLGAASAAESRARQTATSFNQAVRRDMDQLAQKAETIPAGQPLVDGWFIARRINSINISYVAGNVRRPNKGAATTHILESGSTKSNNSRPAPEKSVTDLLKGK